MHIATDCRSSHSCHLSLPPLHALSTRGSTSVCFFGFCTLLQLLSSPTAERETRLLPRHYQDFSRKAVSCCVLSTEASFPREISKFRVAGHGGASSMAVTSSRNRRPPNFHSKTETERERKRERGDSTPLFQLSDTPTAIQTLPRNRLRLVCVSTLTAVARDIVHRDRSQWCLFLRTSYWRWIIKL